MYFRIGLLGIKALEDGLCISSNMTYLNLSGCNIKDDGGVIVANAFKINEVCKVKQKKNIVRNPRKYLRESSSHISKELKFRSQFTLP